MVHRGRNLLLLIGLFFFIGAMFSAPVKAEEAANAVVTDESQVSEEQAAPSVGSEVMETPVSPAEGNAIETPAREDSSPGVPEAKSSDEIGTMRLTDGITEGTIIEIADGISGMLERPNEEGSPSILTKVIVSGLEKAESQSTENPATKYVITHKNSSGETVKETLDLSNGHLKDMAGKDHPVTLTGQLVFLDRNVTTQ